MKARFLFLAAVMLGLASCQTEPEGLDVNVGGEQLITINVAVPEAETRAGGSNSALGVFDNGVLGTADDNTTMRYILQVYYKDGENFVKSEERKVEYSDGKSVAFDVRLVPERDYQFVVWADVVVNGETDTDNHYDTSDLTNVKLNNTWVAMDESRDAFTATEFIDNFNSSKVINITLKRPFAKLRVVTTDMEALNNLGIVPTKATVTYTEKHYGAFNAFAGKAIGDTKNRDIEHENFAIASYGENTAEGADMTLFTDYFFADDDDVTKFVLEVFDQNNNTIKKGEFTTDIYVKRNNLTTIKGNILTDGKGFDVIIDDAFAGESGKDDGETFANVDTAEELLDAINKGVENITLDGDIDLSDLLSAGTLSTRAAASDVLTVAAGKSITLDLNGKTISYTKECDGSYAMIENKGTLTINDSKGNGKISFKDTSVGDPTFGWGSYTLRNEGTLVVENGTIEHLGEQNSATEVKHMICAIFQYSGSTTINGGTISTPTYRSARLWKGNMTINGGNFNGQLWVQAVDDSSNLTINGGTFAPCGKDGSSIFITNGTYEVQFAVTGGYFNTKIGCTDANKAGVKGCIVGGTFTANAIENTNAALIANGHKAVDNGDDTYTVINLRAPEVEIYGLTLKPDGNNSKVIVNDTEGFKNLTKLFNDWTALFTDGNGTTYTNYANGAGVDYYYASRWTVSLEADIDLNNATISPIIIKHPVSTGSPAFEGNNHTIKNAKIVTDTATENEAGLFGSSPCGFKDLKLDNIHVTGSNVGNSTAGVLAGSNRVGIDNITITNSSVEGGKYTGGVIGYGYTDVTNCTLTNVSVKGGYKLGGLIGYICASGANTGEVTGNTLTNCSVDGIGNGIYAGGKSEYIIGKLVGNYNCNGTCQDNVVNDMTTTANKMIGKIEDGKVVNESNNTLTDVVENLDELNTAITNGATEVTLSLSAGNYTMPEPDLRGKTITITGTKDVVIDAAAVDARDQFVTGATMVFDGVTINFGKINYMGFANTASLTYKNCKINGLQFLFGENVTFENCEFDSNGAEHSVWTYGCKNVSFTECNFTYADRGVNCYSDNDVAGGQTVNFTECTFTTENTASAGAVEINSTYITNGIVVNLDGCTAPAYGELAYVSPWDSTNGAKTTINIK